MPVPAGATDSSPSSPRGPALMSIGEVLALLRTEFPETTISKLRFLETERLVQPQRTASGYRKYDREDVSRLRYILTAQRDHYLPLRVIRQHLEEGSWRQEYRPAVRQVPPDEELWADLERHGLIPAQSSGRRSADVHAVAEIVGQLAEFGVQPRHLRAYRVAADRDAGLFAQLVAPLLHQQDPGARARAAEAIRELVGLSQQLHGALLRAALAETLPTVNPG